MKKIMSLMLILITSTPTLAKEYVSDKKISMDTIETSSMPQFKAIKSMLMKKTLMSSDFSEVNLSKNFTLKNIKDTSVYEYMKDSTECEVAYDRTTQVIYKYGKVHVLEYWTNPEIVIDNNCTEVDTHPAVTVDVYNIPNREEFKDLFINGATYAINNNNYYSIEKFDQVITFNILDDGFSVIHPNETEAAVYRERKIVNPIMAWDFQTYDFNEYGINLSTQELNMEINNVRRFNIPFAGYYRHSYSKHLESIGGVIKEEKLAVSQYIKSLEIK